MVFFYLFKFIKNYSCQFGLGGSCYELEEHAIGMLALDLCHSGWQW
jgi:hypothetical protein